MKTKNLFVFGLTLILWFSLMLVGCNSWNWNDSLLGKLTKLNESLPDNEVVSVMKDMSLIGLIMQSMIIILTSDDIMM